MRTCFLPQCDARNADQRNRTMFVPPRDPKLFAKWKDVLPKKRELKPTDKICLLHFNDSDLITTYDTSVNGVIISIPRGRPKLRNYAIPCKNLTDSDYPKRGRTKKIKETLRSPRKVVLKRVKVKRKFESNDKYEEVLVQPLDFPVEIEEIFNEISEEDIQPENIDCKARSQSSSNQHKANKDNEQISSLIIDRIEPTEKQKKIFCNLYEDIYEVELPSTLWAIHRDPFNKFIALTYFDPNVYLTSKTIILNNNLKADIIIFDTHLKERSWCDQCSIEDIGSILHEVDSIKLCSAYKKLPKSCDKISENGSDICNSCLKEQQE